MLDVRVPKAQSLFQRLEALEAHTRDKSEARALLLEVDRQLHDEQGVFQEAGDAPSAMSGLDWAPQQSLTRMALERSNTIVSEAMQNQSFDGHGRAEVFASKETLKHDIKGA